jgi:hypothetical protein
MAGPLYRCRQKLCVSDKEDVVIVGNQEAYVQSKSSRTGDICTVIPLNDLADLD